MSEIEKAWTDAFLPAESGGCAEVFLNEMPELAIPKENAQASATTNLDADTVLSASWRMDSANARLAVLLATAVTLTF